MVNINSSQLMQKLNAVSIVRLGAKLICDNTFSDKFNNENELYSVYISCVGKIIINTKNKSKILSYSIARELYFNLISKWCINHKSSVSDCNYNKLMIELDKIRNETNSNMLKATVISFAHCVEQLCICNNKCTDITLNKETSNCVFLLNNKVAMSKFSLINILHTVSLILTPFIDKDNSNNFFDINKTKIRCNGDIFSDEFFIECKSTFNECKEFSINQLLIWREYNVYEQTNINKVDMLINDINNSTNISDIYDLCDELYEKLNS